MTLMIKSWPSPGTCGVPATGSPCDPCKPPPPPPPPPPIDGGGLPPFTDAAVHIDQYEVYTTTRGEESDIVIGGMVIYSAIDNISPQGAFGVPLPLGPIEYGFVSAYVLYLSSIQILHPFQLNYISLSDISTGQIGNPTGNPVTDAANTVAFEAASVTAGNAAIAQANQVLGNPT